MKNKKYLILKGCAGLGNRLITLANAIHYAQKSNRILLVDWSDGMYALKGQNIFYDYFQLKDVLFIKEIGEIEILSNPSVTFYPPIWGKQPLASLDDLYEERSYARILKKIVPFNTKGAIGKVHGYWHQKNHSEYKNKDLQTLKAMITPDDIPYGGFYRRNLNADVVFFADWVPTFYPEMLRKHVCLAGEIKKKIEDKSKELNLGVQTIGIHVRMTDNKSKTPFKELAEKIEKLGLKNYKLFLATDDANVEAYFQENYRNVVYVSKWRPPNIEKGGVHHYATYSNDYSFAEKVLTESIVDMYLLAKCKYLIYQGNSTFSRVSSGLKNQPDKTFSW